MIDTVLLTIAYPDFTITKPYNFSPPAIDLFNRDGIYKKFYNNGTAEDGRVCLTLYRRPEGYFLKIQFSAPKLLYKNNLQEVIEIQLNDVVEILYGKLSGMGIMIKKEKIKVASVSGFHPSKNILINGSYPATLVIAEIAKINLTEKLDLDKTKFRNDGHGLQFWAKTHSLVFYDKIADLSKTESRSFGKDQKMQQQSLFDFMERKIKPEILRMEVRLADKRKMNTVLKQLGLPVNPTFSEIFKESVCQKILQHYFQTYIQPSLFVFDISGDSQAILKRIIKGRQPVKNKQAIYLLGLWEASKDKGVRPLRKILKAGNWDRIAKDLKYLNTLTTISRSHSFIKDIMDGLKRFEPYRLLSEPKPQKSDPLAFLKYQH